MESFQNRSHNFVIDLAHRGVSVAQWLEHRSAESEGLRFDSSWGLRNFSLFHARDKTENILPLSNCISFVFTEIRCRKPRRLVMRNGNVTTSDPEYLYGATLAFECNEGYELRGSDSMTCLRFGWSPRRPPYCASKHVLMIEIMLKLTYVVERDRNSLLV